ncbi:MAG: cytochrome b N-terminal domain-containing protein [Acidobacteriota bacterium]
MAFDTSTPESDGGPELGPGPPESAPDPWSRPPAPPLFDLGPWRWGTLAAVLGALLAVTGAGLAMTYRPTPGAAGISLLELRDVAGLGFLRDVHYWAGHGLLIAAWVHVLRVFMVGSYRRIRGWTATVVLLGIATAMAATGSSLAVDPGPGGDGARMVRIWVLHCLALPALAVATVAWWWRSRRGDRR